MRSVRTVVAVLAFAALEACSYTNVIPIAAEDRATPGIRYYECKPILLVGDQGTSIAWIPNYNRAYAIGFGAFLAKNDFRIEWDTSCVKVLSSTVDTTAVIDLLKAAEAKIPGGPTAAAAPVPTSVVKVYEFVFTDEGDLVGLRPLPMNVNKRRIPGHI
jgi:hypothetical protein